MTKFSRIIHVRIDGSNRSRLEEAAKTKRAAHLHFSPDDFNVPNGPESQEFHEIALSDSQLKRLNTAMKSGSQDIVLVMYPEQLKMQGGFLGSLIGLLMGLFTKKAALTAAKTILPTVLWELLVE